MTRQELGRLGGLATWAKLTKEQRSERQRKCAEKNWELRRDRTEAKSIFSDEDSDLRDLHWHYCSKRKYAKRTINRLPLNPLEIKAHRLVMSRMLGRELTPEDTVDHIDGNPLNNRRDNLRLVTRMGNCQNRIFKPSRGANFHKATGMWQARVGFNYTRIHLGLFPTREQAAAAAAAKRAELGFLTNVP